MITLIMRETNDFIAFITSRNVDNDNDAVSVLFLLTVNFRRSRQFQKNTVCAVRTSERAPRKCTGVGFRVWMLTYLLLHLSLDSLQISTGPCIQMHFCVYTHTHTQLGSTSSGQRPTHTHTCLLYTSRCV